LTIVESKIIAPDSSHWGKWLDAMSAQDVDRRQRARTLHRRLLDQGRIPLLTWHHLEELLAHEDGAKVKARVACLQDLPLVAYLRLDKANIGLGSIVQVLAAEALAASEGHRELVPIRDRARELLLKTGSGTRAIGAEPWVWEAVVRPVVRSRSDKMETIAALRHLRTFDEKQTIGELLKAEVNSPAQRSVRLERIHTQALQEAMRSSGGNALRARAMASDFMARVLANMPPPDITGRELIVSIFTSQA
jgi:predicted nucleic acid-binding protein